MFRITTKVDGNVVVESELSAEGAARLIEGWASKFSDKEPTRYGMRITLKFLASLVAQEFHTMNNRAKDGSRHALVVTAI